MEGNGVERDAGRAEDRAYEKLMLLEDLESLLEEIEELDEVSALDGVNVPNHLREQMEELDVNSADEIRARIAALHREIDEAD
jgi:hypothetical protein